MTFRTHQRQSEAAKSGPQPAPDSKCPTNLFWRDFRGKRHDVEIKGCPTVELLHKQIAENMDAGSYGLMLAWRGHVLYDEDLLAEVLFQASNTDQDLEFDNMDRDCVMNSTDNGISIVLSTDHKLWVSVRSLLESETADIDLSGDSRIDSLVFAVQRAVGYTVVRAYPWTSLLEVAQAFDERLGDAIAQSVYFHQQKPAFDGVEYCRSQGHVVKTLKLANVGPGSVMRLLKVNHDQSGHWVYQ
ncbi:hypothetical protein CLAFUW4_06407 [Fulvia fulva]|uniref:Uncharacterized protein n=1 Tax=Passalora fulva TaxID=5499 RepID=A0A9Q8P9U5_PASFU|nr:uncharacterized protein CLAFUR5_06550 [Fulvia fulva]KAK4623647.1 hypothetical protein CLAFUR4_06410 [Fulvia fulva]UJO18361.1 hypothetical protein CLAFUR5_06550 [Fulvia fulva]WPV14977.1 hypothetical protein CLAFUW4_06407 [Fulvia fulva]WPV30101.1 hypothetical protein CLAFUW7_20117 [Fulvia fulva]